MSALLAVEPTIGAHRERQEDGDEQHRPHERHQHRMLGGPGPCLPSGVQKELPDGRGGRGERIPLGNRPQPRRHRGRVHEDIREKTDRPDQDLHRCDRLRPLGSQPTKDPDPQQSKTQEQEQSDRGKGG